MAGPEIGVLLAIYNQTHGVALTDIQAPPVAPTPEGRRAFWTALWLDLGFGTDRPTGSSRLLEVAMAVAGSDDSILDMLRALFEVVGNQAAINRSYEGLLKELWIPAQCHRDRFGAAFDFLLPVPAELTQRQAYLIFRFIWDRARYSQAELDRLRATLGGPTLERVEDRI